MDGDTLGTTGRMTIEEPPLDVPGVSQAPAVLGPVSAAGLIKRGLRRAPDGPGLACNLASEFALEGFGVSSGCRASASDNPPSLDDELRPPERRAGSLEERHLLAWM